MQEEVGLKLMLRLGLDRIMETGEKEGLRTTLWEAFQPSLFVLCYC